MKNTDDTDADESTDQDQQQAKPDEKKEDREGWTEKLFTVFSLLLIAGLVGYLLVESFKTNTPPAFELKPSPAEQRGDFVAVRISVKNGGEDTAKAVQVRGEIAVEGSEPVQAEATLDWLPGRSSRDVTLLFSEDAATSVGAAKFEVVGYEEP